MSKRNISYVSNEEPSFIKKFKQKIGYKEGATVDSKRAELERDDSDGEELDDDKPTVVVLRKGDLTAEQAEEHVSGNPQSREDDEDDFSAGKIMFKKPKKKDEEQKTELGVTSSSKTEKSKELDKKLQKDRKKVKKINNKKLLSFDDEEEEEG